MSGGAAVRRAPRMLRTKEEIFAAGRELGRTLPPLTEDQVNACARILAPVINAPARKANRPHAA